MQLFFSHCPTLSNRVLFCPKNGHVERIEAQLHLFMFAFIMGFMREDSKKYAEGEEEMYVYTCHKGQGLNPLQYIIVTYVPNVRLPSYQETQDIARSQIHCLGPGSL